MQNTNLDPEKVWQELAGSYSSNEELISTFWLEIQKNYSSPKRYYHNLGHLNFMLELVKRYEKQLRNPAAIYFAIFYHDLVYKPASSNNEAKSAEIAVKRLRELNVPEDVVLVVEKAILATKSHELQTNQDINFLLDFDLAILGADYHTYQAYTQNIRKEYAHVPEEAFKAGRKKVLQHFLAMPAIYKTPLFRTLLEARAHHNLQIELQQY